MSRSRLHELSDHGVSVWIDSLSREMLETGELARLMEEDAVVGVTSNPTIFQKALSEGDWYDAAAPGRGRADGRHRPSCSSRSRRRTSATRATCCAPVWERTRRRRRLRLARGRPDARLRPRRAVRAGDRASTRRSTAGTSTSRSPAPSRGWARSRTDRRGALDQRHPDLLARAVRGGRRGVPPRARAARRGGRRPRRGALGRELLRLPGRHRGRPAARRGRTARPEGQARGREREARVPALAGGVRGRPLGGARVGRRAAATLPLGVDLDEEPRLPRRPLRRGARSGPTSSTRCRRDDSCLPGPRRGARHARDRASTRRARCSTSSPPPASTTTTWSRRSSARACRSSPTRSRSCSTASRARSRVVAPPARLDARTRSRRASGSGGSRIPARSSSSAPRATSRTASSSRRSTRSPIGASCPSGSRSSASRGRSRPRRSSSAR